MKVLQILVLIFGFVILANAQKAVLSGTVSDEFGGAIGGAKVEIKGTNGKTYSTFTDSEGFYRVELEKGTYQIEVATQCYQKFNASDYKIAINGQTQQEMQLDVALEFNKECKTTDCFLNEQIEKVQTTETKISDKILQRPLGELPKEQNKTKRKNN